jgi:CDP-diacylglycerol--glycerol-3-phosphate 3-phosphatidyltransferase
LNLPNSITLIRIGLMPIFVLLLFAGPGGNSIERWVALFLFVLAISTDGLDGAIARRTNKVTNLGKILDPIADKALIGGALLALSFLGEIDWWVTILILGRDLAVTAYRLLVVLRNVISASLAGKFKTILQGVAIGVVLAPFETWFPIWSFFEEAVIYLALAATLISGFQFFVAAAKK